VAEEGNSTGGQDQDQDQGDSDRTLCKDGEESADACDAAPFA
jgi:hypothetical protein